MSAPFSSLRGIVVVEWVTGADRTPAGGEQEPVLEYLSVDEPGDIGHREIAAARWRSGDIGMCLSLSWVARWMFDQLFQPRM